MLRVAYTLEQCWHRVPGGTATAAVQVARLLDADPGIDLRAVAGRHRRVPVEPWDPGVAVRRLPFGRPLLYETWLRLGWPRVERATGVVDVCHATGLIPAPTAAPLVVSVHDLAFVRYPERFTGHGVRVMSAALGAIRRTATIVVCPSQQTADDLVAAGIDAARLRLVPLGVSIPAVDHPGGDTDGNRRSGEDPLVRHGLAGREFVLYVGTIEPRKNLPRLVRAVAGLEGSPALVVAGAHGWGEVDATGAGDVDVRFLGHVADADLAALYSAAAVFAYPSEWEGFGLPILEAMAHGAPVVTSRGTATEEVAGGAAVLVDPLDIDDIASGLESARRDRERLVALGRARARAMSWGSTAAATVDVYREVAS